MTEMTRILNIISTETHITHAQTHTVTNEQPDAEDKEKNSTVDKIINGWYAQTAMYIARATNWIKCLIQSHNATYDDHRLRIRILQILFFFLKFTHFHTFQMPQNFKNKIQSDVFITWNRKA